MWVTSITSVRMSWWKPHNPATGRRVGVKATRSQAKRQLLGRALSPWLHRWHSTGNNEVTYELFQLVCKSRLHTDFYLNQILSGYVTFGDHQARFFKRDPTCFCRTGISMRWHSLQTCTLCGFICENFFLRDLWTRTLLDLCLDGYSQKNMRAIVKDLFLRTFDRDLGSSWLSYQSSSCSYCAIEGNSASSPSLWHWWWWCMKLSGSRLVLWTCICSAMFYVVVIFI